MDVAAEIDAQAPRPLEPRVVPHEGALPTLGRNGGLVLERIEEGLEPVSAPEEDFSDDDGEQRRRDDKHRRPDPFPQLATRDPPGRVPGRGPRVGSPISLCSDGAQPDTKVSRA